MNADALQKALQAVSRKNPKLAGLRPKVSEQGENRYLLLFTFADSLPGSKSLEQSVRVIVDGDGRVIKMSSSR